MSDKARRVRREPYMGGYWYECDNGTHMLVPVEVWERVKAALENSYYTVSSGVAFESLKAALAEMGGSDD